MSVAGDVVEGAVRLVGELFALHERADEAEKKRIEALVDEARARLGRIEPNAPRIHQLAEKRRSELEHAELERRQDEPTRKTEVPR